MPAKTYASYLDKEQRKLLLNVLWDGNTFNAFMKDNLQALQQVETQPETAGYMAEKIASSLLSRVYWSRFKDKATKLGYLKIVPGKGSMARPFSEQLPQDVLQLCVFVLKAIKKEEKKEEIKAAATGAITITEAQERYYPLVHFDVSNPRWGIKVHVAQLDLNGNRIKNAKENRFYTWNHWEMLPSKKYYQPEEIEAVVKKILNNTKEYYDTKMQQLSYGMKTLEKISNKY